MNIIYLVEVVMNRICVIGSLNMDIVINAPRVPLIGETIHGSGFMTNPGGKGANQAVAAARLGGQVKMAGCIGKDIFGQELLDSLNKNNVNTDNVVVKENSTTGIADITVVNGDNFIILDAGANFLITKEMIASLENVINGSDIVLLQHEIPLDVVEEVIHLSKANNIKVLLNPAPAYKIKDELLKDIDILTPNEKECEVIIGKSINTVDDARMAVRHLMDKGVKQVIITMGEKGVIYNDNMDIIHKPAIKVKAVDTTAAGDSFSGAVAVAISNNKSIGETIDFANKVGALTVTRQGAQQSLPYLKEVNNFNL
jgi:ribokinase